MNLTDFLNTYAQDALSAFASAAPSGGLIALMGGARNWRDVAKAAAVAGGINAAALPAAVAIGRGILGSEEPGEKAASLKRAALGYGTLGLLGGVGLAASPNLVRKYIPESYLKRTLMTTPKKKLALLAPLLLGGVGALYGADEGAGIDALQSQR